MYIYGIDFTSAPCRRKPIVVAIGQLEGLCLNILGLEDCEDWPTFEACLHLSGPWIAALDFPFGLPAIVVAALGWPSNWTDYVTRVARLALPTFLQALQSYSAQQPRGQKLPRRQTDVLAGALSPLMLHGVPLARMFWQGAPRLLASGACVLPCCPKEEARFLLEGYPALVARRWLGRQPYKNERGGKEAVIRRQARARLLATLTSAALSQSYGLTLALPETYSLACLTDARGDHLDALLCAVQAAWAAHASGAVHAATPQQMQHQLCALLPACNPDEGWIYDPALSAHACIEGSAFL
ncbi:DUF429 domain-containing protein [Thermogemmatispora sp.]|uniref:DUF429 domain-containing protein n=1 Tax=Thermogemmatispora sp. TaxID=1968838 RepID=UPI001D1FFCB4|nr:DUF429 domain-containing protein [Thermogemmatispora sp.]MBX5448696.1 DUF429 domain-containing protein [Thermogemmatispora sp.]